MGFYPLVRTPATEPQRQALEHAKRLHPHDRGGQVRLAIKMPVSNKPWREWPVEVSELADALPALVGQNDAYLTVNRFNWFRRIAHLRECGALFSDVDFHEVPRLRGVHPFYVVDEALTLLQQERVPEPSLAVASGRGLYLFWLHTPIPRQGVYRWMKCQERMYEVLRGLGADRGARDAARVLRIPGTRNSKSGLMVETIRGNGEVWPFDALCDEVLPFTRAEIKDLRAKRAARSLSKRFGGTPQGYGTATLQATRLDDLQKLRELRWFGEPEEGFRDKWLFLSGVAMSWLCPYEKLQRELYALAREVGGWSEGCMRSKMHAVFRTTREAINGHRVEWRGMDFDPRYRFRSETIMEWLGITSDEEKHMVTLISQDERRRRHREKLRRIRREAGIEDRFEIASQNRVQALRMAAEGQSTFEIAEALKLSQRWIQRLLKEAKERGELNETVYVAKPGSEGPSPLRLAPSSRKESSVASPRAIGYRGSIERTQNDNGANFCNIKAEV